MLRQSPNWTSADVATEWTNHTWNLTGAINRSCSYQAAFIKTGGKHNLNVKNVRVLVNGEQWGYDFHTGTASLDPNYSAFFEFTFEKDAGDAEIELVAEIRGDGGTDTQGDIVVVATEFKSVYPTP